jgi:hypothetical protein
VLPWSDEVRGRARETVDDLRALVAAAPRWGAAEEARAGEAAARWEGAGVGPRRSEAAPAGDQLFAFLRREITGVVAELDRVLSELARAPEAREPLRSVLRRMRPVRGVAGMNTLSPVLEVLEGIEDAAHDVLSRTGAVEGRQLETLRGGRDALAAAGNALESGAALETVPELERFRELRDRDGGDGEGDDAGVVPISRLFYDDDGPRVVSSPLAPAAEAGQASTLSADVEGFLRIEATGFLDRAEGLIAGLASRPQRFARAARQLSDLAASVSDLAVTYGLSALAGAAEQAAGHILRASQPEEARVALARLRASLPGGQPLAELAVEVEPDDGGADEEETSPAARIAAAADESGVVPVEALFYDAPGALREALAMRDRISSLAGSGVEKGTELGEALDELFSLVELGLAQAAVRG